ncbi:GAF domain-containing protein [Sediminitomix flava]|uniref:GAF domain-containing protein n=1 Tax=Sediminitomix flava TaxID=379075 RepID=A0A315Z7R6_SEDFL|nr:GAF domain-containing protein [Sediminitomix flava]PWJ40786.1 GAF domain-containing protein [Sediminitomix flava]
MAEDLILPKTQDKTEIYEAILPQIKGLITYETDLTANLANVAAVLKEAFDFFWVGFYLTKENQLVLGPFQGPVACTRIPFTKGVCGAAYTQRKTLVVDDVESFPGHIACSSLSKSEVVVPIFKGEEVVAVLDVDSKELSDFNEVDEKFLTEIGRLVGEKF